MTLNTASAHQHARPRTGYELRCELFRQSWRVGQLYASHCLEIAVVSSRQQPALDPLVIIHAVHCMGWSYPGTAAFRSSTLATLEREGRKFLAKAQDDAAMAAAALWYACKNESNPTGHDLLDVVSSWQTDIARP